MMTHDILYSRALTGDTGPSVLMTDAYKSSMAQAGFPLRPETFNLTLRRGGPHFLPFNFAEVARHLLLGMAWGPGEKEWNQRSTNPYQCTAAMLSALESDQIEVWSPPAGSWVGNGEPILTVTAPSFKASWLEPLAIMFRFPIQVATAIKNGVTEFKCSCEDEERIVRLVLEALNVNGTYTVTTDQVGYLYAVAQNVQAIKTALNGELHRAFEVGLRAASCIQMHRAALVVCQSHGLHHTSSMFGAMCLGLTPVGTTGHEHQQRWMNDEAGFRAMRDMRSAPPSYLFDTYDALEKGIPAAIKVMEEDPTRKCAVRFDSGDQDEQLRRFLEAERLYGIRPLYIFEDSYTAQKTVLNEAFCNSYGMEPATRLYGYGGFIVNPEGAVQFRRDDVSAVYKLSQTGTVPVMKTCGEKSSLPGKPILLVSTDGHRIIAQQGEYLPNCEPLTAETPKPVQAATRSFETSLLINLCRDRSFR